MWLTLSSRELPAIKLNGAKGEFKDSISICHIISILIHNLGALQFVGS